MSVNWHMNWTTEVAFICLTCLTKDFTCIHIFKFSLSKIYELKVCRGKSGHQLFRRGQSPVAMPVILHSTEVTSKLCFCSKPLVQLIKDELPAAMNYAKADQNCFLSFDHRNRLDSHLFIKGSDKIAKPSW